MPRLLELFRRADIRASFFVTMGPDRSGRAIRRALRPSFLLKMWRTNPVRLYGVRTLLSGTLLPSRPVGSGDAPLLRQVVAAGHELAVHGWDHVGWQDRIARLDARAIRADLALAAQSFEAAVGVAPHASAAPGWRTSDAALSVQEDFGFRYASDTRGDAVFRPSVDGVTLATIQVPTTMPTMDELLGRVHDLPGALAGAIRPGINVLTLHAEVEGGPLAAACEALLAELHRRGVGLTTLDEVAGQALARADELPVMAVVRGEVSGRSGWIATQGRARARRPLIRE